MRRLLRVAGLASFLVAVSITRAADVPTPESVLGFRPGADFHLAQWEKVVDYFRQVDAASDRVVVRQLGSTTEGRPYIVAIVSSPETIRDLDRYRKLQASLADPRTIGDDSSASQIVEDSKPVVLITCSIHSTETASTLMATELLHDLAARNDAITKEILDKTILLLDPSANPDGVEKVALWYERSKGHPWEGSGMIELYHKYAGHDTNRDWFMLNLKETQLLSHMLYREWFPTITYDVHQMGSRGARLFVPPFYDPINPNLDPRIHQSIALIGAHMAADLAAAGKRGVLTHAMYDNWWNGGNRTTPQRHNMVGVLTEAASVRLASPIFLDKSELRGGSRGFADHKPAINFVDPWPGGWWHLRDIVEYELVASRALLTLAARYRNAFQQNYLALGRDQIAKGKTEPPFAWIVPSDQRDPGTAAAMVRILNETGIEVRQATDALKVGSVTYPAGSWVLPAAQPYRAHLKDMMERQQYPPRFTAGGAAEPPYDVAGWTLPLQMGVRAVEVAEPLEGKTKLVNHVEPPRGRIVGADTAAYYAIDNQANDDFTLINALFAAGVEIKVLVESARLKDDALPAGALLWSADGQSKRVLDEVLPRISSRVRGLTDLPKQAQNGSPVLRPQRIGVYQPWVPVMDEGWTRLVLEKFKFPYVSLHNADIRAGGLRNRLDAILIPSMDTRTIRDGYTADQTEPAYTGGLGAEGAEALRQFVEEGGTLVCLAESCSYAIEHLGLPVNNVLKGLASSVFYCPGSILAIRKGDSSPITYGFPQEASAYFDRALAFDPKSTLSAKVVVNYASSHVLESGWLQGPDKIQGKGAVVEVGKGQGHVILFGFPPQHRGQPQGTFRLLFNALLRGGFEGAG